MMKDDRFTLVSDYAPSGDQPQAISSLLKGIHAGHKQQTLLGVTGSGKTFTMANIIKEINKPTLILSPNKTLAAQLYGEFKNFFPHNAVHYFVSYFDYYQPEAYIPQRDIYIEKDSNINEEIDKMRLAATASLLTRKDVIIVASVSCIYGIGSVENFDNLSLIINTGDVYKRDRLLRQLTDIQYSRKDSEPSRGNFRVRGESLEIYLASDEIMYKVIFDGDKVDFILKCHPITGKKIDEVSSIQIFPAKHFVTPTEQIKVAVEKINQELETRLNFLESQDRLVEATRLRSRVGYDMEMLLESGFVKGIENYSRYLTNREPGEQPATLLDYFSDDSLFFIDESHISLPQVRGMYFGDRARKEVLVEYGFRLPSALDNRPLTYEEFWRHLPSTIFVSATPGTEEKNKSLAVVEQIIRPTGLLDPLIEVRPIDGQVDDIIAEINKRTEKQERVLITTLTKRLSEDLTNYLKNIGIKVAYLHSDIDTLERTEILRDLRLGKYDVLIGINLLREGLDLPEVSLVAIFDADKEGFLRSETSLVQTIGRGARHQNGTVIMYADRITDSMKAAIDKTNERRELQTRYNQEHGITPMTVIRKVEEAMNTEKKAKNSIIDIDQIKPEDFGGLNTDALKRLIKEYKIEMEFLAESWQFEQAALLRDRIADIESMIKLRKV